MEYNTTGSTWSKLSPGLISFEQYANVRHRALYAYRLRAGTRRLYYIGVSHNQTLSDWQFSRIARVIRASKPDVVIIEGAGDLLGQGWSELPECLRCLKPDQVIRLFGENLFAARIAYESGAKVLSGDAGLASQAQWLFQEGYSRAEIFVYFVCQQIVQSLDSGDETDPHLFLDVRLDRLRSILGWSDFEFSLTSFQRSHRLVLGTDVKWHDRRFYEVVLDPVDRASTRNRWTRLNALSQSLNSFRDARIIQEVSRLAKLFETIVIVYGATHAYMQRGALTQVYAAFDARQDETPNSGQRHPDTAGDVP